MAATALYQGWGPGCGSGVASDERPTPPLQQTHHSAQLSLSANLAASPRTRTQERVKTTTQAEAEAKERARNRPANTKAGEEAGREEVLEALGQVFPCSTRQWPHCSPCRRSRRQLLKKMKSMESPHRGRCS